MEGSFLLDKALDGSFIGYHLNGTIISEVFLHDYQKLCKQSTNGNDFMWMFWLGTAFIFWIKFYESTANEFRPSLIWLWPCNMGNSDGGGLMDVIQTIQTTRTITSP